MSFGVPPSDWSRRSDFSNVSRRMVVVMTMVGIAVIALAIAAAVIWS